MPSDPTRRAAISPTLVLSLSFLACTAPGGRRFTKVPQPLARPPATSADTSTSDLDDSAVLTTCPADSDEYRTAVVALDELAEEVHALPVEGEPARIAEVMKRVLAGPCFTLSTLVPAPLDFDSALSLKTFWDYGGATWLGSFLHADGLRQGRVWFPPSVRHSYTRESAPGDPLVADLLCSVRDDGCGRETAGWRLRAERDLHGGADFGPSSQTLQRCESQGRAAPVSSRFATWYRCLSGGRPYGTALPLGEFRAPKRGWLVLRGNRNGADQLSAYSLESGAAYIAEDREGDLSHRTGRLPVDALREAVWMALLSSRLEGLGPGFPAQLPPGILPQTADVPWAHTGVCGGCIAWTPIAWSYVVGGRSLAHGVYNGLSSLIHPDPVAALVEVAEAAMVRGRPGTALPSGLARWRPSRTAPSWRGRSRRANARHIPGCSRDRVREAPRHAFVSIAHLSARTWRRLLGGFLREREPCRDASSSG